MSILYQGDKREFTFHTSTFEDVIKTITVTNDDGTLLRFDRYKGIDSMDTELPLKVTFRQFLYDVPFITTTLNVNTDDPRQAVMNLLASTYPDCFRSRKVYFECSGKNKVTGQVDLLFYGQLFIKP